MKVGGLHFFLCLAVFRVVVVAGEGVRAVGYALGAAFVIQVVGEIAL